MSIIIGRSLSDIRKEYNAPHLTRDRVVIAAHEAAHATVALATGSEVTEVYLRSCTFRGARGWEGECKWRRHLQTEKEEAVSIAAGVAVLDLLDDGIAGTDAWAWGAGDLEELSEKGLTVGEMASARSEAVGILRANKRVLDEITCALLENSTLSESDLRNIAVPAMVPDRGSDPANWTRAQRNAMADSIKRLVDSGPLPSHIQRKIDALTDKRGGSTIPKGIQHSDTKPLTVPTGRYWHQPTSSYSNQPPVGYEHRALVSSVEHRQRGGRRW